MARKGSSSKRSSSPTSKHSPSIKIASEQRMTSEQQKFLVDYYQLNRSPSADEIQTLSSKLDGFRVDKIERWFRNRRNRLGHDRSSNDDADMKPFDGGMSSLTFVSHPLSPMSASSSSSDDYPPAPSTPSSSTPSSSAPSSPHEPTYSRLIAAAAFSALCPSPLEMDAADTLLLFQRRPVVFGP
ncbi:hypothetical protein K474DRAFT_1658988 [Panus rudis PR-1116 ss-1]|nr:hypothetical protein K474DRAFT_1658988 [Panus rudis PR-1116 ss-1]